MEPVVVTMKGESNDLNLSNAESPGFHQFFLNSHASSTLASPEHGACFSDYIYYRFAASHVIETSLAGIESRGRVA